MARAVKITPYEYILEEDRALPKELQTVFHIKLKTVHDANLTSKRYLPTIAQDAKGKMEMDSIRSDRADYEEFCHVVSKIENFDFGEEYYDKYPQMKERATEQETLEEGESGLFVPEITEKSQIADVARYLPNLQVREILKASDDRSALEDGVKKQ